MKRYLIYFISLFFFSIGHSQTSFSSKLDSLLNLLSENNQAMGSLALLKNGEIIYKKTIGYVSIENKKEHLSTIPSNVETKYRIGSISKMFTAVMVFQLIEEGKISLDTKLAKFYPKIQNASNISIGNLLNHHSGIHNFTSDADYSNYYTKYKSKEEMLALIEKLPSDFKPGSKGEYSNSNYILLGYLVEKISQKTYAQNLKERITDKLNLSNTFVGGKIDPEKNEALSYMRLMTWDILPQTDLSIAGGAGTIISTPEDLSKFIYGLFRLKLCSANSLSQMKTMQDGFGMGMFKIPFYTKIGFGHNGGIDGFTSTLSFFTADSLAIAYCSNAQVYPMNSILLGALNIYYQKEYTLPVFKSIEVDAETLKRYEGNYINKEIPFEIKIYLKDGKLMAQGKGQGAFPLDAFEKDKFKFDAADVKIEFDLANKQLTLIQNGYSSVFDKK